MTTEKITATAKTVIANVGNTAHQGVGLYRKGGKRLATVMGKRWDAAFKDASPKLSAETRKNAAHAQEVIGSYYSRGLALSADGAVVVIDTLVGGAITAIDLAATLKQAYGQKSA
ncbi:hypothetical protein [Caenimonas sp. SL110]|uniref:hypothetical protein n=1 Tax=Caenimonas sp. SL110 TaxID=1450524 RepID=UPI000653843C|nr:hypothetical protein [Caenimonas sp. SL110]